MTGLEQRGEWWSPARILVEPIDDLAAEAARPAETDTDDLAAAAVEAYRQGGVALSTATYRLRSFRRFLEWAGQAGVPVLPTSARHVAAYLQAHKQAGCAPGYAHGIATALRWVHDEAGEPLDEADSVLAKQLAAIALDNARVTKQAAPMELDLLGKLLRRDHRRTATMQRATILAISRQLDLSVGAVARGRVERVGRVGRGGRDEVLLLTPGLGLEPVRLAPRGLPHYTPWGSGHPLDAGSQLAALMRRTDDDPLCLGRTEGGRHSPARIITGVAEWVGTGARQVWNPVDDRVAIGRLRAMDRWLLKRLRDDALLCLCWFGALRMDEAMNASVRDWTEAEDGDQGVGFIVARSKTDQTGDGAVVVIPKRTEDNDMPVDPTVVVERWLVASGLAELPGAPLFSPMPQGVVPKDPAHHQSISSLVAAVQAAGGRIDHKGRLSGHSARRGWAVEASRQGVPVTERMAQMRQTSYEGHRGYCQPHVAGDTTVARSVLERVLGALPPESAANSAVS